MNLPPAADPDTNAPTRQAAGGGDDATETVAGADAGAVSASELAPARRMLVFFIISLALLMMSIDSTIVATALHALQTSLDTTINLAGWTLTAYAFGFIVMLPISGKLSERYGRRRVFIGSAAVFTLASLLCGLATDIYALIGLRVLQAVGGAGFTPSATGIIVKHFGSARDRAVSLFGSIFPIGAIIGPIFGGLFVSWWSWRLVFFVNVPLGLLIIALGLRYIPRDRSRASMRRISGLDLPGMVLLAIGLLAAMLAINQLAESGGDIWNALFLVPLAIALLGGLLFFRHIRRAARPFIVPRLIYGPGFGAVNLINLIFGGATIGAAALIPLYAINRYGMGVLAAGSLLMARGVAAILLSLLATLAIRRSGYRLPIYVGGMVIALGFVLLAVQPLAGIDPYVWLAGATFLTGIGAGMLSPASRNAGLQLAPDHSSTLAALRTMGTQMGIIATISIATAVLAGTGNTGTSQAWVYVVIALLLVFSLPIVSRVPEHYGSW